MIHDCFGLENTTCAPAAVAAFEGAVKSLAGHRPATGTAIEEALFHDPQHIGALALAGFAHLILARAELAPIAAENLRKARAALTARGGSRDEHLLVAALSEAAADRFTAAATLLEEGFSNRPALFLPFKLAHALRFMIGDRVGMLQASQRMMDAWNATLPAAGFLAGCHAFALEEHGFYTEAERIGREAVALEAEDAWGLHAVSHVYEMRGALDTGIAWLEANRANWTACNNFSFHMAWHLALLHLEQGNAEAVLRLYDEAVRPTPTDDFRDMANAVSLLWRMERHNIRIGDRWAALREIAWRRRQDTSLIFASLHYLLALLAVNDRKGADELVAALALKAQGEGDQAHVAARVGLPLARLLIGMEPARTDTSLDRLALSLQELGGSHAQRDLFLLALAEIALAQGERGMFQRLCATRHSLRAEDRLIALVESNAKPSLRYGA